MSIEALWAVQFTGVNLQHRTAQTSGGVLVIETGRLFGGDTWQWYTGSYRSENSMLLFRITTGVHFTHGGQSIFGTPLQSMTLVGEGSASQDQKTITVNLVVEGNPQMQIGATLTRVAELP